MADADPSRPAIAPENEPAPGSSASISSNISRGRMSLLFTVMLVTAAGNTAMQSVMPSIGTALGVNDVWISLAYSWSALLWVACAPIWARRSDRRGRKQMMALGMIGFAVSMALCGAVLWFGLRGLITAGLTLGLFAAARSLYGLLGSAAPPAVQAYVASRTARSERTKALSLISSSFGLGTVIGPALAPLLVFPLLGLVGPFVAFALFAIAALAVLWWFLPNDEPQFAARGMAYDAPFGSGSSARHNNEQGGDEAEDDEPAPDKLRWTDKRIRPWLVAGLLGGHAHAMILGIAGFLVLDRLGLRDDPALGAGPVGIVLMSGAFATLLAQWGLIPTFHMGPRASTLWGIFIAAAGVVMFAIAGELHGIALGFAIASLGFGLFRPGFVAGASLAVSRAEQGQISGVVASINGAAFIFAPAIGVWLYNATDLTGWVIIVALLLAVAVIGWRGLQSDEALTQHAG